MSQTSRRNKNILHGCHKLSARMNFERSRLSAEGRYGNPSAAQPRRLFECLHSFENGDRLQGHQFTRWELHWLGHQVGSICDGAADVSRRMWEAVERDSR
mmetsp:Transcript_45738/g.121293  ORF Transcript_45738/g.121293 Transcript_45738/m.121293 type:complete len:100 (-) Transcript_45738:173-472(-)